MTPPREAEPPATTADVLREVLLLQDQLTDTRGEAMHPDNVAQAVKLGLMQAVADPQFWTAAQAAMQQHAKVEAGGWLLGGLKGLLSKLFWFALAGIVVYNAGGWSALALWFKGSHP